MKSAKQSEFPCTIILLQDWWNYLKTAPRSPELSAGRPASPNANSEKHNASTKYILPISLSGATMAQRLLPPLPHQRLSSHPQKPPLRSALRCIEHIMYHIKQSPRHNTRVARSPASTSANIALNPPHAPHSHLQYSVRNDFLLSQNPSATLFKHSYHSTCLTRSPAPTIR